MSDERIRRISAYEAVNGRAESRTDFEKLAGLSDAAIADAAADDPDAAPVDLDWSKAEIVVPARKVPISIRLDEDVLAYFRDDGAGYQGRINSVLRRYMREQQEKSAKT